VCVVERKVDAPTKLLRTTSKPPGHVPGGCALRQAPPGSNIVEPLSFGGPMHVRDGTFPGRTGLHVESNRRRGANIACTNLLCHL
jgi:hypothetical protein